ncbi:unnamed protein product [Caenorhabditis auriculariae]|uniref:Uncharacterized protein n=1 Tax=Caenorhabditis auriculariae TaxID=2777116 RepID=A0A8S1GR88_9PELO|nr:unnamed protein product [Caenorhabditis auriculariae]
MIFVTVFIFYLFVQSETKLTYGLLHEQLPAEDLKEARDFGAALRQKFLEATINSTIEERLELYDEYFSYCNDLGQGRAKEVFQKVASAKMNKDIKLLLTLGMTPFAARFINLDLKTLDEGMKKLCEKYELQLQCQLGFGESRAQILLRIEELKNTDGNLRVLLQRQCPHPNIGNSIYHCFSRNVEDWASPCFKEMLAYNYTRFSTSRRIARIHKKAVDKVANLTKEKDHVQAIFVPALKEIAEIEGERCEALRSVMNCVKPLIENKCGSEASEFIEDSVLVGYVRNQRQPVLASQFFGFGVETKSYDAKEKNAANRQRRVSLPNFNKYRSKHGAPTFSTMSIEDALKREKRSGKRAVKEAKRDIKRAGRNIENAIRPPWYRRAWNRIRDVFRR